MNAYAKTVLLIAAGTAALGGCGKKPEASGSEAKATASTDSWNATDACALLDKVALGEALGDAVNETSLGLVNQAAGANAATSECTYKLKSGSSATLMARNSPIADNTEDAIKLARSTMQETVSAFTSKKIEDIPGVGKAAFFVPGINQMNVFIDDKRFVILTIPTPANGDPKDVAVALIGKIKS